MQPLTLFRGEALQDKPGIGGALGRARRSAVGVHKGVTGALGLHSLSGCRGAIADACICGDFAQEPLRQRGAPVMAVLPGAGVVGDLPLSPKLAVELAECEAYDDGVCRSVIDPVTDRAGTDLQEAGKIDMAEAMAAQEEPDFMRNPALHGVYLRHALYVFEPFGIVLDDALWRHDVALPVDIELHCAYFVVSSNPPSLQGAGPQVL